MAAIGILLLLIVGGLALMLHRSKKPSGEEEGDGVPPEPPEPLEGKVLAARLPGLKAAFRKAVRRLRRYGGGRSALYKVPWFLMVGDRDRRGLLAQAGLGLPFGPPGKDDRIVSQGLKFWFFDRGVVLDAKGVPQSPFWLALLRQLQRYRPRRPVDGAIVTVPASQLLAARRDGATRQELQNRAERLYERLWQAQKRLGIRFPIYLVVSGCESIPGFTGFGRRLPEQLRDEAFGWSSPYGIETAFRPDWVKEAFRSVSDRLRRVQAELLTAEVPPEDADDVFFYPGELVALEEPLRAFATRLFQQSAYHETLIVRGIYFTGAAEEDLGGGEEELVEPPKTLFVRDLAEQKVFPEANLGSPTAATLLARNRRVLTTQVALFVTALLLAAGTWWGSLSLHEGNQVLVPFLDSVSRDLVAMRESRSRGDAPNRVQARRRASELFDGLSRMRLDRYSSIFLPASWFASTDRELRTSIRVGFEEIIYLALRLDLEQRTEDLLNARTFGRTAEAGPSSVALALAQNPIGRAERQQPLISPLRQPAFQDLRTFVQELVELERKKTLYNGLGKDDGRDLDRLGELVDSLFGYRVPEGFFDRSGLYASAAVEARRQPLRSKQYQEAAGERLRELARSFDHAIYEESALLELLTTLEGELDRVRRGAWLAEQGAAEVTALTELLEAADQMLSREEVEWIFRPRFELGDEYGEVMSAAQSTDFVDPEIPRQLMQDSEVRWIRLRSRLADLRSPITGSLLALDEAGRPLPQLSADLQVLKTALQGLEDERFMVVERGQPIRTIVPAGSVMRWDTNLLEQAVGLYEPYTKFLEAGLALFRPELRGPLQLVAKRRLQEGITDLIARSQGTAPAPSLGSPQLFERELRGEIEILQRSAPILGRLLAILEELQLWEPHRKVSRLVSLQGFQFLERVDDLLTEKGLYEPLEGDFSWWQGSNGLALAAFDVADDAELASYLDRQRDRVQYLARQLAEPLVASLSAARADQDPTYGSLYFRWQQILAQLDGYQDKRPGNSLAQLESFILEELPQKNLRRCSKETAAPARTGSRSDFFLARLEHLRTSLRRRCTVLVGDRALVGYRQLAEVFNRTLAGRLPFSEETQSAFGSAVEPEVLRDFFELHDRHSALVRAVPADAESFFGKGPEILDFMSKLARVRTFFAPFLDPPEEGKEPTEVPTYDVKAEFRVNREREEGALDVLGWYLEVGDQVLSFRDSDTRSRWELGEPLRLRLHWAADGPRAPVPPTDRPGVWVDGRNVVFESKDRWALLTFLRQHQAARRDFAGFSDPQPHTLRFEIETLSTLKPEPAEDDAGGGKRKDGKAVGVVQIPETARVFVRLLVMPPDGETALELPVFPAQAPELPEPEAMDGDVQRAQGGFYGR